MRGLYLIVYGDEGMGKTSLALQFPKPLRCLSINEFGYDNLDAIEKVPKGCENIQVEEHPELLHELKQCTDVKTVIIDSASGYQQIMKDNILQEIYATDQYGNQNSPAAALKQFGSWGSEGYRIHGPTWAGKLEQQCLKLQARGINVILIGHTCLEKSKSVTTTDYQAAMLNMEKNPRAVLTKSAQAVLYMTLDFSVKTTKEFRKKPTEAKVTEDMGEEISRIMYTTKHPAHSAKNCLDLPPFIDMGESEQDCYENFVKKLPKKYQEHLKQSE